MNPLKKIRLGPRMTWIVVNTVMALVLVAGLTAAGWFTMRWWEKSSRAEVLDAAHEIMTTFLTISPSTVDRDITAVEDVAVGTFAEEWEAGAEQVKEKVLASGAKRSAEVQAIGYVKGDSDSAELLVAVDITTSFTVKLDSEKLDKEQLAEADKDGDGYQDPVENRLRIPASFAKDNGEWKMSEVEVST